MPGGQIAGGSEAAESEVDGQVEISTEAGAADGINDALQAGGSSFFWLTEGWNRMSDELKDKIIGKDGYPLFCADVYFLDAADLMMTFNGARRKGIRSAIEIMQKFAAGEIDWPQTK